MTLTLKQMQDLGMNQYFSDKEVAKHITKALQEQEKLNLQKQKQIDDVTLKLTEMEQKYAMQLNQEAQQNMLSSVNNGQIFDTPTN